MNYDNAYDIAEVTLRFDRARGWKHVDGAARAVALDVLASGYETKIEIVEAFKRAVQATRISINPRWDGSIA